MNDRQLRWVQKAKGLNEPAAAVGLLAQAAVRRLGQGGPAWRQKLISVLYDELGPELTDHAEPISVSRGVLTFRVGDPAVAYHLRYSWEQRLLQLIAARFPQAGIHSVRFAVTRPQA
jgi:hypothetical protein